MKQNKVGILLLVGLAAFFFMKKKDPPVIITTDLPPDLPPGLLTIEEKFSALQYYANQKSKDWTKLQQMTTAEIQTLYTYIFDLLLTGKRVSSDMLSRINLIKYKYQIAI